MKNEFTTLRIIVDGDIAVIRIHPPPLNQISPLLIEEMRQAFERVHKDPEVKGIILTGTGSDFISGMDISWAPRLESKRVCLDQIASGHGLIRLIERGPKPVVAAMNGNCSRGALEIALGCHYRIGAEGARLGMLEVRFGLIPMMGGTQRLPRLVGMQKALEMITEARDIPVEEAKKSGLIEETAPAEALAARSESAVRQFILGRINFRFCMTSGRSDRLPTEAEKVRMAAECRERLVHSAKGYLAPFKALKAMADGLSPNFGADLEREADCFCDCALSSDSKNLITLYLNTRNAGAFYAIHGGIPKKIRTVGVLGGGDMGSGIAALLLERGMAVRLWDDHEAGLRRGMAAVHQQFSRALRKGRISVRQAEVLLRDRLKGSISLGDLEGIDLALDTGWDALSVKRNLFQRLEAACGEDTLLGICASTVPLGPIASVLERPDRLIGLRFFKPPDRIRLLEVSRTAITPDDVLATVLKFARKMRKVPVVVNDGPGGFTYRQVLTMINEFGFLVSEGVNPFSIDRAATEFGLPIGIAQMSDLIGMDEVVKASRCLSETLGETWPLPPIFDKLYATGCYGRKTGSGWYDYGSDRPTLNFEYLKVVKAHLKNQGISPKAMAETEILNQLLTRSLNEGVRMMEEGFSDRPGDLDMAMVYGAGFPAYRGGIFRYADAAGMFNIHETLVALAAEKGPRFQPAEQVREMARSGQRFYSD
ncbi:MAG: enoyl-CoA hydratase-related protein [Thermodesulfobacteriota bacterium]